MATASGSHAGFDFQPGGGVRPGVFGRDDDAAGVVGADVNDIAAQILAAFAASSADRDDAVDVVVAVVVAVADDDFGAMPICSRSDFRFPYDDGVDTAAAVAVAADDGVDTTAAVAVAADEAADTAAVDAVVGFFRQDGYP